MDHLLSKEILLRRIFSKIVGVHPRSVSDSYEFDNQSENDDYFCPEPEARKSLSGSWVLIPNKLSGIQTNLLMESLMFSRESTRLFKYVNCFRITCKMREFGAVINIEEYARNRAFLKYVRTDKN